MDHIISSLNKWAKKQSDIERVFFFMSGYIDRLKPAYTLIVTTKDGEFGSIKEFIDMLEQPIEVTLKVFADDKLEDSSIPKHAIKITPPNSGRLRI